jgi:hypothetical protein
MIQTIAGSVGVVVYLSCSLSLSASGVVFVMVIVMVALHSKCSVLEVCFVSFSDFLV